MSKHGRVNELGVFCKREDEQGFKVFKRRVHIGNTAENLTENDYYLAYDIVTE